MNYKFFIGKDSEKNNILAQPTVIGDTLNTISPYSIPDEKVDIVMIKGHGDAAHRNEENTDGSSKETAYMPNLISGKEFTIDSVLAINEKMHPTHWDIIGCHQGSFIHDIGRNADKFAPGTTFSIPASSKYTINEARVDILYSWDKIWLYRDNSTIDQAQIFGAKTLRYTDTLFFAKIVQDQSSGHNKMIAFKAVAPKKAVLADDLKSYVKTEAKYVKGSKEHLKSHLITIEGDENDPAYQELKSSIKNGIDSEIDKGWESIYKTYLTVTAAQRGKIDIVKKFLPEDNVSLTNALQPLYAAMRQDNLDIFKFIYSKLTNSQKSELGCKQVFDELRYKAKSISDYLLYGDNVTSESQKTIGQTYQNIVENHQATTTYDPNQYYLTGQTWNPETQEWE